MYGNMPNMSNMYTGFSNQNNNNLIRVNGYQGANAYQMGANGAVALFDNNSDVFYVKQTDGAGFPTIRMFEFKEITQNQINGNSNYVRREEMEEYVKQFIQEQSNKQTESNEPTT